MFPVKNISGNATKKNFNQSYLLSSSLAIQMKVLWEWPKEEAARVALISYEHLTVQLDRPCLLKMGNLYSFSEACNIKERTTGQFHHQLHPSF